MKEEEIVSLLQRFSSQKVYIYGAGGDGTLVYHILQVNHINIQGFIVDDGYRFDEDYRGTSIFTKTEFMSLIHSEKIVVLVAMNSSKRKGEIISELKSLPISFLECHKSLINELLVFNCIHLLSKNNIDYQKENIKFINAKNNQIVFPNPFKISEQFLSAFAYELPDLLMPQIDSHFNAFHEGSYEYENVQIEEGDVVVDCGANIGVFSAIAAANGAKVIAFEPVPKLYSYLIKLKNKYESIEPQMLALSDSIGQIEFMQDDSDSTSGSIVFDKDNISDRKKIIINCTTLDNFVVQNNVKKINFIKADIEGAERLMLEGARNTLAKWGPKISICLYHFPDDKEVLTNIIMSANPKYKISYNWKKLFAYIPV